MEAALEHARDRGADHLDLSTSEDDVGPAPSARVSASTTAKGELTGP
jgi:hypothetical protein